MQLPGQLSLDCGDNGQTLGDEPQVRGETHRRVVQQDRRPLRSGPSGLPRGGAVASGHGGGGRGVPGAHHMCQGGSVQGVGQPRGEEPGANRGRRIRAGEAGPGCLMTELGDRASPFVYRLRVVLRGVSPLVWRRLLVRSDSTIGDDRASQVAIVRQSRPKHPQHRCGSDRDDEWPTCGRRTGGPAPTSRTASPTAAPFSPSLVLAIARTRNALTTTPPDVSAAARRVGSTWAATTPNAPNTKPPMATDAAVSDAPTAGARSATPPRRHRHEWVPGPHRLCGDRR
jgi:hypothetical protein